MKKEEVSLKEFSEFIKGYEMCASYKIEKDKLIITMGNEWTIEVNTSNIKVYK